PAVADPMIVGQTAATKGGKVYLTPQVGKGSSQGPRRILRQAWDAAKELRPIESVPEIKMMGAGTTELAALQAGPPAMLPTVQDTQWELAGAGDFDRDGNTDLLWRYYGPGDE